MSKENRKKKKISVKKIILFIGIWIVVLIIYLNLIGYVTINNQRNHRIAYDGYAIVYENDDYYYLAKYDSKTEKINLDEQKIISKSDIGYEWKRIENPFGLGLIENLLNYFSLTN